MRDLHIPQLQHLSLHIRLRLRQLHPQTRPVPLHTVLQQTLRVPVHPRTRPQRLCILDHRPPHILHRLHLLALNHQKPIRNQRPQSQRHRHPIPRRLVRHLPLQLIKRQRPQPAHDVKNLPNRRRRPLIDPELLPNVLIPQKILRNRRQLRLLLLPHRQTQHPNTSDRQHQGHASIQSGH